MKHTHGDWFASGLEIISMPSQIKISKSISGANYEEAKANAKLVAAAPHMLYALQYVLESGVLSPHGTLTRKLENAINKATK